MLKYSRVKDKKGRKLILFFYIENIMINKEIKKGFTLLELLIVIGILAILATTVTVILNPAELLRQARDSQRLSDLESLNTAINLYVSTYSASTLFTGTSTLAGGSCSVAQVGTIFSGGLGCNPTSGTGNVYGTAVNGNGWVTINFGLVPTGSPLSRLPVDPLINSTTNFYGFKASSTANVWEINGVLESNKYAVEQNLDANDGGNQPAIYEIGSAPALSL